MRCPRCHHKLAWNANYTALQCTNTTNCGINISPMGLKKASRLVYEEMEEEIMQKFSNLKMPDFVSVEQNLTKMKGD